MYRNIRQLPSGAINVVINGLLSTVTEADSIYQELYDHPDKVIIVDPPEYVPTQEEIIKAKLQEATALVDAFIKAPIDNYNQEHGTAFANVHNCASYINNPAYSHYQFCKQVWNWSVDVWETARAAQEQVATLDEEHFVALLPVFELK